MSAADPRQPRIPPRPPEDWDAAVREALTVMASRRVPGAAPPEERQARPQAGSSNVLGTYLWHPEFAKAWLTFSNHLFQSTLPERMREIMIVRVAWLRQAEYEWAQHVRLAKAVGVTSAEIDAISVGPTAESWAPLDAALLRSADEICEDRQISDATWDELATHLDRKQLIDLVFTVGAYDLLAVVFKTFGIQMDPGLEGFPT